LIKYQFIKEQKKAYPVKLLCKLMQVSRSANYNWLNCKDPAPSKDETKLKGQIKASFDRSKKAYGSRRLVKAMKEEGIKIGRFKVRRLMEELNLKARYPKRFKVTTDSNHQLEIAPNKLNRQFNPAKPNEVWVTDLSHTPPGKPVA
jgi:putative transposase